MKITKDKIKIKGSLLGDSNPLPMFHDKIREKPNSYDDSFLEEDKVLFAYETGFRVLPYKMQDNYSRDKSEIELDIIDLENEKLRARFLPGYGGRLISLFDKELDKELLFSNPVFQPANLATRDAWFSGGIEWNISQFGHSYLTCEPMFFASLIDENGHAFLRMYEYERNRKIFFSIDFHLPPGARHLGAHVRIVNDNKKEIPMYWWTNIAVPEERDIRVFSESDQVIYIKPESNIEEGTIHQFGRGSLVDLPSLPGKDASRPMNFNFASEYFFQNPVGMESPWEAALYNDGFVFFERSTSRLLYRKMFCWGTHKGGRNWCDFLSEPGKGDYLEIQAGLAPTQVHGLVMPGETEWEFTQIFGSTEVEKGSGYGNWIDEKEMVKSRIDSSLSAAEVTERDRFYASCSRIQPTEILYYGSGWAYLEEQFRSHREEGRSIPAGFSFPAESLEDKQQIWMKLMETGRMDVTDQEAENPSWMVDTRWEPLLADCSRKEADNPWPLIHLGILKFESGRREEALKLWQDSIARKPTALAWRNIAVTLRDWDEPEQAIDAMRRAVALREKGTQVYLIRELMEMLVNRNLYDETWKYYKTLSDSEAMDERILTPAAMAAYHLEENAFLEKVFSHSFANIKEGETRIADLWYLYQARKEAEAKGIQESPEHLRKIRRELDPPPNIDFTMTERD